MQICVPQTWIIPNVQCIVFNCSIEISWSVDSKFQKFYTMIALIPSIGSSVCQVSVIRQTSPHRITFNTVNAVCEPESRRRSWRSPAVTFGNLPAYCTAACFSSGQFGNKECCSVWRGRRLLIWWPHFEFWARWSTLREHGCEAESLTPSLRLKSFLSSKAEELWSYILKNELKNWTMSDFCSKLLLLHLSSVLVNVRVRTHG